MRISRASLSKEYRFDFSLIASFLSTLLLKVCLSHLSTILGVFQPLHLEVDFVPTVRFGNIAKSLSLRVCIVSILLFKSLILILTPPNPASHCL
jgi:hypothetical protein